MESSGGGDYAGEFGGREGDDGVGIRCGAGDGDSAQRSDVLIGLLLGDASFLAGGVGDEVDIVVWMG